MGSRFLKKRYNEFHVTPKQTDEPPLTYETIYEDGETEWGDDEPEPGRHRVQVTVLDQGAESRDSEEIEEMRGG